MYISEEWGTVVPIQPIEPVTDRNPSASWSAPVPPNITAAAQSLGISPAQMSRAASVGSTLTDVAQSRGISQQALVAAMQANPPANVAAVAVAVAQAARAPLVGRLDVLA